MATTDDDVIASIKKYDGRLAYQQIVNAIPTNEVFELKSEHSNQLIIIKQNCTLLLPKLNKGDQLSILSLDRLVKIEEAPALVGLIRIYKKDTTLLELGINNTASITCVDDIGSVHIATDTLTPGSGHDIGNLSAKGVLDVVGVMRPITVVKLDMDME